MRDSYTKILHLKMQFTLLLCMRSILEQGYKKDLLAKQHVMFLKQ